MSNNCFPRHCWYENQKRNLCINSIHQWLPWPTCWILYIIFNIPGGLENPRSSVIGLFRRESVGSEQHVSSSESTPQRERRGSGGRNAVLLIEDGETDPLGVLQKQMSIPPLPQPPQTPGQRRQPRRGSMLELSGCVNESYINHMWTCSRWKCKKLTFTFTGCSVCHPARLL